MSETDKTCGACAHWRAEASCNPVPKGMGFCALIANGDDQTPRDVRAALWSWDGATLLTLPTFGCVLHAAKGGAA